VTLIKLQLPTVNIQIAQSWEGAIATKDTGTVENWIDFEIVRRFELEIEQGYLQEHIVFDGKPLYSCEVVTATWCVSGSQKSHTAQFRVVRDAPFDVLFGRNFLANHAQVLNSKEARSASAKPNLVLVPKKQTVHIRALVATRSANAHVG